MAATYRNIVNVDKTDVAFIVNREGDTLEVLNKDGAVVARIPIADVPPHA